MKQRSVEPKSIGIDSPLNGHDLRQLDGCDLQQVKGCDMQQVSEPFIYGSFRRNN